MLAALEDRTEGSAHWDESTPTIHIFATANLLRRPIVVVGDPKSGMRRDLFTNTPPSGKLLPVPLVLAHRSGRFHPLVRRESRRNRVQPNSVPLVSHQLESLKLRMLLEEEESSAFQLQMSYFDLTEIRRREGVVVLCAKLHDEKPTGMVAEEAGPAGKSQLELDCGRSCHPEKPLIYCRNEDSWILVYKDNNCIRVSCISPTKESNGSSRVGSSSSNSSDRCLRGQDDIPRIHISNVNDDFNRDDMKHFANVKNIWMMPKAEVSSDQLSSRGGAYTS